MGMLGASITALCVLSWIFILRNEIEMFDVRVMLDPEKYGYKICSNCNGYGSSLKEDSDRCTKCGGWGLVKKEKEND